MELALHAAMDDAQRAELVKALPQLGMLQDVVRWAFSLTPPADIAEVVVQDEYTHDVVLPWRDLWLVFDST